MNRISETLAHVRDEHAFSFAGFQFPKCVWTLPKGKPAARIAERRKPACTGPYYHAPKPDSAGRGAGFYLDSDGMPGLRWQWCDEINGTNIRHEGWYADEFQDTTIRGIVFTLPKNRGFLAGWSMGAGMASGIEPDVYDSIEDAAHAADSIAENVAEREREYQERENARTRAADAVESLLAQIRELRAQHSDIIQDRAIMRRAIGSAPAIDRATARAAALRIRVSDLIVALLDARSELESLGE